MEQIERMLVDAVAENVDALIELPIQFGGLSIVEQSLAGFAVDVLREIGVRVPAHLTTNASESEMLESDS